MDSTQVEALSEAAADGVSFDGFEVRREDDSYVVATGDSRSVVHESDLAATLADYEAHVTNWYFWHAVAPQGDAKWAFLRWLEGAEGTTVRDRYDRLADGHTATWGELAVTVELGPDGHRVYHLRNERDVDAPADDLERYEDPLEARRLAKHDDRGRYRPLKTAPSLSTGWRFAGLDAEALLDAVDFFYPATVPNWYRERQGDLDVTHWAETAERQTGIYGVVSELDRGAVEWVAEACCVDSQCLKRREWDVDADTPLDAPRGDGEFPCREPCSLVVAASRRWTKLEEEEPRTYEFELTPSEKEQVEDIVEAVADGRVDDIREADVYEGANRYRARFLRAKRFDEHGNLGGVPTHPDDHGGHGHDGHDDHDEDEEEHDD